MTALYTMPEVAEKLRTSRRWLQDFLKAHPYAFHLFRHTYATWLRRYAGADAKALVGTGAWESEKSASRYAHTVIAEDARLSDQLPVGKSVELSTRRRKA